MKKSDTKLAVSRASDKFILRLPDGMRAKISVAAAENGRSMNSEIVSRLEVSFAENSVQAAIADLRANMARISEDVASMAAREGAKAAKDYRERSEAKQVGREAVREPSKKGGQG
jgi:plasmid stability protein